MIAHLLIAAEPVLTDIFPQVDVARDWLPQVQTWAVEWVIRFGPVAWLVIGMMIAGYVIDKLIEIVQRATAGDEGDDD